MADFNYRDRTDDVAKKLRIFQEAHAAGRLDIAIAVADSLRESLRYERQRQPAAPPAMSADSAGNVADLPKPWAEWARGWSQFHSIQLFETVGIARSSEPVETRIAFPADRTTDLFRETRVACVDAKKGALVEVPSQVSDEFSTGNARQCTVSFAADVAAHGNATYFLFAGNPHAERPDYLSDLKLRGTGYDVEIANHHYVAKMSQQSGQLERLTFARQHGLELYAGGKGHGEPPGIDWGHDYVDAGNFQKLRMRNWESCRDFEIESGPIFVRLRRWGFPHSPLHPVFTPSRVHMDVEYRFHTGLPYFFKQSRFDVVEDVSVSAMRDDEWVFSGYSFTDPLWIDAGGHLHEGEVPAADQDHLWGAGFVNKTSRDLFIALRLLHTVENFDKLPHNGAPQMHYDGHGQLWSRYPVVENVTLPKGTIFRQQNAYLLGDYPKENASAEIERVRHRLLNPLSVQPARVNASSSVRAIGSLARPGELDEGTPSKVAVWNALRQIQDEQFYMTDANIVDLGYVYDVRLRSGTVHVLVTMPHRGRPRFDFLESQGGGRISDGIRERVSRLPGVRNVVVELTWSPRWSMHRMTSAGLQAMGIADHRNIE